MKIVPLANCCSFPRLKHLLGSTNAPTFVLSRWLFLRLLGLVYFVAFASLGVQWAGLFGSHGLLPVQEFLPRVAEQLGHDAYRVCPTICWWNADDGFLSFLCWGGAVLSLLLVADVAPLPILIILWICYSSLTVAGQAFLSFQWDALLLETGLLAILYAPAKLRPGLTRERRPPAVARWLLYWLLFRLMFLSGITKLVSQDPTWADWTALNYHYQTQPLPTWTSWYAHHAPAWFQQFSLASMYVIEVVVPFLIFAPPRLLILRRTAASLLILLQLAIAATGNYGYFNCLTIVLCVPLLDDALLSKCVPTKWRARLLPTTAQPPARPIAQRLLLVTAIILVPLGWLTMTREIQSTASRARNEVPTSRRDDGIRNWMAPLRIVNGYGLFRVMTTQRNEIIIEGSQDGNNWQEYEFRWKPGSVNRRPQFITPHMPRLDWQMWFAALQQPRVPGWLVSLLEHLLRGTPEVLDLLGENPFPDTPPAYVRLVVYRYTFTSADSNPEDWWHREQVGTPTPALTLPNNNRANE